MSSQKHQGIASAVEHCAPYWAGEYAVAYKYFSGGARTREKDVCWMELQMFKEWTGSGVYGDRSVTVTGVIRKGLEQLRTIEGGGMVKDLDEVSRLIQFGLDEFEHFKILYKLYRRIAPDRKVSIFDMGNLPEAIRMVEMRQSVRETHPLGDTIVDLTEGGGLGMYFGIAKAFESAASVSDDDKVIRDFAYMTINDETEHMKHRFRKAMSLGISPQQWEEIDRGLQTLFAQKLTERNEQLGNVCTRAELDAMARDVEAGRAYVRANLGFLDVPLALAA
jgi:hypothetical protein